MSLKIITRALLPNVYVRHMWALTAAAGGALSFWLKLKLKYCLVNKQDVPKVFCKGSCAVACLKLKRSSPHFNDGFLVTFKVFWCKANFSICCGVTIISNFLPLILLQKEAFHFVAQFLKKFDFVVDILHQVTQALNCSQVLTAFWSKICLLFFDRIVQRCQIRKMVSRYCILPVFFLKCQNWSIWISYV